METMRDQAAFIDKLTLSGTGGLMVQDRSLNKEHKIKACSRNSRLETDTFFVEIRLNT